jgi:O-antigen ligase
LVPIPYRLGQVIAQGSLWLALLLAVTVNRQALIRPNTFLILLTVLTAISAIVSVHTLHLGSSYRAVRLIAFLATLWLLTPWFGRRDRLLLRIHLRCLVGVLVVTGAAAIVAPGRAFSSGRLAGVAWPIGPTQVAHYAAVTTGLGIVLWLSGLVRRNAALALTSFGLLALILTHTRTAVVGLVVGVLVAGASLFLVRRRVRRAFAVGLVVAVVGGTVAFPLVSHWFVRGESPTLFTNLSGRTQVWHEVVTAPRAKTQVLFGSGLSNTTFGGRPIDDAWLAVYQDQGLVGDVLAGLILLSLLFTAVIRPRGPARALALFLIVYCICASYTEVGLGDASPYLLDLAVAASLLMAPLRTRTSAHSLSA